MPLLSTEAHARLQIAHLPTPLEPMRRLAAELGGPHLLVKRDDCTGLAMGGNKARKLEFLLGEALRQGADVVLTTGGIQSNHVRQTAAISTSLGLRCIAYLQHPPLRTDSLFLNSGNVLLDRLYGAEFRAVQTGQDPAAALAAGAQEEARLGNRPFVVPAGGSNALGALGYVGCAEEILEQAASQGETVDCIAIASGTGGSHAGLLVGLEMLHAPTRVIGFSVEEEQSAQAEKVAELALETTALLGQKPRAGFPEVVVNSDFVGPGYGVPTPECLDAIKRVARLESLLLDPVYTGKAMAGLMAMISEELLSEDEVVVFLHTGGFPGLFAYGRDLEPG